MLLLEIKEMEKTAIGDILSFCGNIAPTEDFKFLSQFSRTSVAKSIKSKITFLMELTPNLLTYLIN